MRLPSIAGTGAFVGRTHELAALRTALDAAITGSAGIVLLAGEPGIGKTRLAEELAGEARQGGCRVLWGRCWDGEGAPVLWPWVQIIRAHLRDRDPAELCDALGGDAAVIAQIVPEIHGRLPELAPPPQLEPAQARFRLFDAIATVLAHAARAQPLLLVLDDLHAADVPSLLMLRFLGQALSAGPGDGAVAPRMLAIGAYRDLEMGRGQPLAGTVADLTREPHVHRLHLGGLDDAEVARCIEQVTGDTPSTSMAAAIARGTNGNPFFVTEIAQLPAGPRTELAGWPAGSPTQAIGIPPTVRDVIVRRLGQLSPACNEVLTIAAVIGRQFSVGTLAAAGEAGSAPLLDALEEAESARVIAAQPGAPGRFCFAHALIREATYESMSSARRIRLHHQVGLALEEQWGRTAAEHLAEIAHHFVQAAPVGDVQRAVTYAHRAGDHALACFAHEEAIRLYEMALATQQASPIVDERSRCELFLALGEARVRAGAIDAAKESYHQAIDGARRVRERDNDQAAAAILARAALGISMAADSGRYDIALTRLLEEAAAVLPSEERALRARVLARLAVALITTDCDWERRAALSREAVELARTAEDRLGLALALHAWLIAAWPPGSTAERLEAATQVVLLAEETGSYELAFRGRGRRLAALLEQGDIVGADGQIEDCAWVAEKRRQPYCQWAAAAMRAMRALLAGRLDEGDRLAQAALTAGSQVQTSDAFGAYGVHLFALRRDQGRLAELEPLAARFLAQFPGVATVRSSLALLYAELGRRDEARQEFETLAADDFAAVSRDEGWLVAFADLSEVCAYLGDTARAAALLEKLQPYADRCVIVGMALGFNGAVSHYLGLLAATLGRWEEAGEHFAAALALHTRMGARTRQARTAFAYAAMLLDSAGVPDGITPPNAAELLRHQAHELLTQAHAISQELEMALLLDQSERLLAGISAASNGAAQPAAPPAASCQGRLTSREIEVLRLLAGGASNQEIADALVVGVRTVERHLLHVYGKIGARRRADAVAYAFRESLV